MTKNKHYEIMQESWFQDFLKKKKNKQEALASQSTHSPQLISPILVALHLCGAYCPFSILKYESLHSWVCLYCDRWLYEKESKMRSGYSEKRALKASNERAAEN